MTWFFTQKVKKEELEQLKQAVQTGFNSAKQDAGKLSTWVKHLNKQDEDKKNDIFELNEEVSTLKDEVENLKNMIGIMGEKGNFKQAFKQTPTVFNKQTGVQGVLNTVQTGVQTVFLDNLSPTERAIVFILLNNEGMKLSYADLAAMMGKSKATIRGQINSIRQKSEGLIEEQISENSQKRLYIPNEIKEVLVKTQKTGKKRKKE